MPETWIYTTHPDVKGPPVKRSLVSFVNSFEKKGWVAVEDPNVVERETPREAHARVFKQIKKKKPVAKTAK